MKYLVSAFSLNMLATNEATIRVREVSVEMASTMADGATPAVGHEDTARVVDGVLGFKGSFARIDVKVNQGDELIVAQYSGPRLEAGAQALPAGAKIKWYSVTIG